MPDYTEAQARTNTGGKTEPAYGPNLRAKKLVVRAESYWFVRTNGEPVNPDGKSNVAWPPPAPHALLAPGAAPWSLIARWVSQNEIVGGWFYVGYGGTFNLPDFAWPLSLEYACNDDDRTDNSGWLHVYENYQ